MSLAGLLSPIGVEAASVDDAPGEGPPTVMRTGEGWHVCATPSPRPRSTGETLLTLVGPGGHELAVTAADGTVVVPFNLDEAMRNLVLERWRTTATMRALSSSQLELFYRVKRAIPRSVQLAARRALIRWQGSPEFPRWPLDDSAVGLLRLFGLCLCRVSRQSAIRFRWFWPDGHRAAAILTHDVESEAGLRNALRIADLEQERGLRSSFNIVGADYPVDKAIIGELRDRGFEIGIHGIHHDRSLFSSRNEFESQLPRLRARARELGAIGFRSPATHRVTEWLPELPVDYDCTVPHSDPYEPQPGGCGMVWPFFIDDLVELPYTMPQDHTLFNLLRERSIDTWSAQLAGLVKRNGIIQCVTHPDPGYLGEPSNERRYVAFLDLLRDTDGIWRALPREVSAWWRVRNDSHDDPRLCEGVLEAGATPAEVTWRPAVSAG